MSYSIDYHFIAFHFEQRAVVADPESVLRCEIGQTPDVPGQVTLHRRDLVDDATGLALVDGF